jgi:hypothetical protein
VSPVATASAELGPIVFFSAGTHNRAITVWATCECAVCQLYWHEREGRRDSTATARTLRAKTPSA